MELITYDPLKTKKIRAMKRNGDSFLITEKQAETITDAKHMKVEMLKISDVDSGRTIFWGDPKEIKEFVDDSTDVKKKNHEIEAQEREQYLRWYMDNHKKKIKWMEEKLKEQGKADELEAIMKATDDRFEKLEGNGLIGKYAGPKFREGYSKAYFRLSNNCPFK